MATGATSHHQGDRRVTTSIVYPAEAQTAMHRIVAEPTHNQAEGQAQKPEQQSLTATANEPPYAVIIHNDDVTTFEFVIYILVTDFQLSEEMAEHVALTAHESGTAIAVIRPRDQAQRLIQLAHAHARAAGYPLTFTMEPAP